MKNSKIRYICGNIAAAALCALAMSGCGKTETPMHRVGVLVGLSYISDIVDGFRDGMDELGYREGEDIEYDIRITEFDMGQYEDIIGDFIEDEVDLIVSMPTEATVIAKSATSESDIPVLFTFALLENMDLVDSMREPGGNITGVRYPGPGIAAKRLEIMLELLPDADRILIPYQRGYPNVPPQLEALRTFAEASGVEIIEMAADDAEDVEVRLRALAETGASPDGMLFLAEPLTVNPDAFAAMGRFAAERNILLGGALIQAEDYSSAYGLDVDHYLCGKQTAPLADKILRGVPAGTIPVVSAESFFQIDCAVAEELGIEVPLSLLSQADGIIP